MYVTLQTMIVSSKNCTSNNTECFGSNSNLTACETKFILHPNSSEMGNYIKLLLVWKCPYGDIFPPKPLLDYICREIFRNRNVLGCSSPSGLILPQNEDNFQSNAT